MQSKKDPDEDSAVLHDELQKTIQSGGDVHNFKNIVEAVHQYPKPIKLEADLNMRLVSSSSTTGRDNKLPGNRPFRQQLTRFCLHIKNLSRSWV